MDKIVISLYVPRVEQRYDVRIPVFLTVKEVIGLLSGAVENLTDGRFHASGDELLCEKNRNILLDNSFRIEDYAIGNGDELILI